MMFLFPNILSNFCVPTLFKEYYEKHSGEAVGRGQTAPMRHPKVSQSFSLGGLTAVNVGKHSNSTAPTAWSTTKKRRVTNLKAKIQNEQIRHTESLAEKERGKVQ